MEGAQVRSLRKEFGWSQDELAKRAKTSQQTIDRIERGETKFSRATLRIAVAFSEGRRASDSVTLIRAENDVMRAALELVARDSYLCDHDLEFKPTPAALIARKALAALSLADAGRS